MKLNLLPTYVGKEKAARSAILLSLIVAAAGIGASVFMITSSRKSVVDSQARINAAQFQAAQAVQVSKSADVVIQNARVVILNSNLAMAMNQHNSAYPDLYDKVRRYVPSFFRVTSMSAQPSGPNTVVTLSGVLQTQQQYADLMLALLRIPGATGVTRQNYQIVENEVPALQEGSQSGRPIPRGSTPIPDDPLERLDYLLSQPRTEGFQDVGGFGTIDPTQPKGAMPNWSLITVQVIFPGDINTPNPQATLNTLGGGPAGGGAPAGGGFTPPPMGGPSGGPPRGGMVPSDTGADR